MRYNKYGNKKTVIDGIKFDSKAEANRYAELKMLEKYKKIKDLKLQPAFEVLPKAKGNRAVKYYADFAYYDIERDKYVVEDVKGMETDVFKLKRKMFDYFHPNIELTIIK